MSPFRQCAVTIGIAGAMAIGTMSSSFAGPLMSGAAVIKAAPSQATEAAWRGVGRVGVARGGFAGRGVAHGGFGRGGRVAAGVAVGVIAGAAAANAYGPYYGGGPYYADPYYADPYYAQPDVAYDPGYAGPPVAYVAPGPAAGSCWVWTDPDKRFGYRRC